MRAITVGVLTVILAGCASLPSPSSSAATSPGRRSASPTSDTPTPSIPLAIGTASPGDAAAAAALVDTYEGRLIAHDWRPAWDLLAPEQQTHWTSFDEFESQRATYFASAGNRYVAKDPVHDVAQIRQWVVPDNYPAAPITPATPDYDRAFLIEVDYPALAGNNAGWEVLLAAPDPSGLWRLWQVR